MVTLGVNPKTIHKYWPMILHSYRFRQFHRTSNGVNPSSSFRDLCSGPQWHLIWQVFEPWASPYGPAHMGQMGKWPWHCTTSGLDNSIELQMERICPAVSEICGPQSLAAACMLAHPDQYDNTPPARWAEVWRSNINLNLISLLTMKWCRYLRFFLMECKLMTQGTRASRDLALIQ